MPDQLVALEDFPCWPDNLASHILGDSPRPSTYHVDPAIWVSEDAVGVERAKQLLSTLPVVVRPGPPANRVLHLVLGGCDPLYGPNTSRTSSATLMRYHSRLLEWLRHVLSGYGQVALAAWHLDEAVSHYHVLILAVVNGKLDRLAFDDLVLQRVSARERSASFAQTWENRTAIVASALAASFHQHVSSLFGYSYCDPLPPDWLHADSYATALTSTRRRHQFKLFAERLPRLSDAPEQHVRADIEKMMRARSLAYDWAEHDALPQLLSEGPGAVRLMALQLQLTAFAESLERAISLALAFGDDGYVDALRPDPPKNPEDPLPLID